MKRLPTPEAIRKFVVWFEQAINRDVFGERIGPELIEKVRQQFELEFFRTFEGRSVLRRLMREVEVFVDVRRQNRLRIRYSKRPPREWDLPPGAL